MKPLIIYSLLTVCICNNLYTQVFAPSLDKVPVGWTGQVFALNTAYPKKLPKEKNQPWLKYDFKTQPKQYINAVLQYFLEGNTKTGFVVQQNKTRKWFHAPSMSWQPPNRAYGREFIHGLTRERNSPPKELYPTQTATVQNWAVGFYNAVGAYTFGKVWADTNHLALDSILFPEGTVTAKLLFTTAAPAEVPYLKGSLEWKANINTSLVGSAKRSPRTVRLLQVDIAVKDARANAFTGWVFGTFAYNAHAKGGSVWKKLVPVGLIWGNDPGKMDGQPLTETWINPEFVSLFKFGNAGSMHVGYKGRLNGPVDNPVSSCLSCHATAQSPQFRPIVPDTSNAADLVKFFRNLPSGEAFGSSSTGKSMDYSLQLAGGVAAALANRNLDAIPMQPDADNIKKIEYFITSMEDSSTTVPFHSFIRGHAKNNDLVQAAPPLPVKNKLLLLLDISGLLSALLLYRLYIK